MNKPAIPGELVYSSAPWKIYRQDAGMGEKEYRVFLNDVNFCVCDCLQTAHEIIRARLLSTWTRRLGESPDKCDGVYRP